MRIGVDAHFVGVRHGGNELYFENILRHLSTIARPDDEYYVFSYRLAGRQRLPGDRLTHLPLAARSVYWQRAVEIPYYCRRLDLDVLHVPFNFLPAFRARKVVTIHDVAFLELPRAYAPVERARMTWLTRFAAQHADHVLTLSEFSRRSIADRYGVDEGRITVTPCAADRSVFRPLDTEGRAEARRRTRFAFEFLLYVGAIQARKNLLTLLRAFEMMRARRRDDLHLVLVGRRGWEAEEVLRFVAQKGLGAVVHHLESVDTETLVGLYNTAAAFVFPSLFEGFGMPVLEAMSCGCPVVCSNAAALPEVYGDAALPFDPNAPEELAAQLERVLDDGTLRSDLVRRGFANAGRFSWERTASIVDRVYRA
ncbi:MAG: glycosyltransferase family 1 protein [Gemmatimonadales bacterium]|jgi:glycosyltransferase involved in cell wall biosynthesis